MNNFQAALIALPPTLIAITGLIVVIRRVNEVAGKVQDVHIQINSRMDELLRATGVAAMAVGNLKGRAEQTAEQEAKEAT